MSEDRSLEEFVGGNSTDEEAVPENDGSAGDEEAVDADDETHDADERPVGDDETHDADERPVGDGETHDADESPVGDDETHDADPAESTATWSPGDACETCGEPVERRWRDGDAFVCSDCKDW